MNRKSSFSHYIDAVNAGTDEIKERENMSTPANVQFVKEFALSDIEYFKKILADAEKIGVKITWGFDEQQADPFHSGFNNDEFVRRLKRLVEGNPKTYGKTTLEHTGERPK